MSASNRFSSVVKEVNITKEEATPSLNEKAKEIMVEYKEERADQLAMLELAGRKYKIDMEDAEREIKKEFESTRDIINDNLEKLKEQCEKLMIAEGVKKEHIPFGDTEFAKKVNEITDSVTENADRVAKKALNTIGGFFKYISDGLAGN